ncbi:MULTISPECIES: hypothetical protein [Prochlorococcus]|uniref:Uncharacterized protein n=1 Tax=Prochlorococcus marinus (strain SARG / CCMP1375 / SS120) TaxID=167539 RepID=Q7VCX0_PROMA|nr:MULTISPECIES: hypothetical protein [Prochlorococcus]AAP99664.1 Predicted protein family PM-27 [Prochlorococcus marinus subsp. marinus str. CCMP1375]KGG21311.1 putative protein family PM-27 [Prochlorococcus marinus str. SS2]KGG24358.1 putative protein family PM-27 [Prochlorococcus marinus str. SS35]KGG33642.1 putative protein family PM-27 [Prochlorococcus marinus str. SS51]KGG36443.1 putative protein family PM-27 [Prochlorococcus sp. SS52]
MDSFDPLNSVTASGTSFDTVRLIMLMIGTFFFGALTAAVQRGIKEQGWFGFKKPSRTTQTKEQMQRLEDIANNANDSE